MSDPSADSNVVDESQDAATADALSSPDTPPVVLGYEARPTVTAEPDDVGASLWRVGTLTYTSAGIVVLFFWLLWGDFALSMRDRTVGPTVQLFLRTIGASNFTMSVLLSFIPPAIGLVLSPIVSYRSDRLRSRWGRRIPFLLIPTPIAALAMIGIAVTPRLGVALATSTAGRLTQGTATLIIFGILWTVFEVAIIVSGSVLGGLINDVVPRRRLGRFFGMFRAVSLIDGMIFNFFLLKFAESHFTMMFTAIGVVFGLGFMMMCLNVREGEYPPLDVAGPTDDPRARGFLGAARVYFRECFSDPYYRLCFTAFVLSGLAFQPVNLFSLYYAKQIGMDLGYYGRLVTYSYIVSLFLAYPLGWLVDRYHPLRTSIAALVVYAVVVLWGFLTITDASTFGAALVLHTVLSGTYFTTTASLSLAMLPRSKFAQFSSAGGMVGSIAGMIAGPSLGFLLDRTGNNYRLTFIIAFGFSCIGIALLSVLFRKFQKLGGQHGYVAPGDVTIAASAVNALAARH